MSPSQRILGTRTEGYEGSVLGNTLRHIAPRPSPADPPEFRFADGPTVPWHNPRIQRLDRVHDLDDLHDGSGNLRDRGNTFWHNLDGSNSSRSGLHGSSSGPRGLDDLLQFLLGLGNLHRHKHCRIGLGPNRPRLSAATARDTDVTHV